MKGELSYLARKLMSDCRVYRERHETAAQSWEAWGLILGLGAAVGGVVAGFVTGVKVIDPVWASLSSAVVGVLAATQTFLKPTKWAEDHKRAGIQWASLGDEAEIFFGVGLPGKGADAAAAEHELESLLAKKGKIALASPTVSQFTEAHIPEVDISLEVTPDVVRPGGKLTVAGTLKARHPEGKPVEVTFWSKEETPIMEITETHRRGRFSKEVNAPMNPRDYYVYAEHEGIGRRARIQVRPDAPQEDSIKQDTLKARRP